MCELCTLRPIATTVPKDANPRIGSSISVKKEGAFRIADATIAVAHSSDVMMQIVLIGFAI
jgi:hypothetical protein